MIEKPFGLTRAHNTHEPTEDSRQLVVMLGCVGLRIYDIAKVIGLSEPTLRKHYKKELETGRDEANARVADTLFRMATSGRNVPATIFWLKSQAGWSEKVRVEHSGNIGNADLLTNDERAERLAQILEQARARRDGSADSEPGDVSSVLLPDNSGELDDPAPH